MLFKTIEPRFASFAACLLSSATHTIIITFFIHERVSLLAEVSGGEKGESLFLFLYERVKLFVLYVFVYMKSHT